MIQFSTDNWWLILAGYLTLEGGKPMYTLQMREVLIEMTTAVS